MKFYFLGIAGAGVSALASVLVSQGHTVTGSDEGVYPPVSTYLDRLGIKYYTHFDAAHVPPDIDAAIIGTTAKINPRDNAELAEIVRRGVPHYTFADYLGLHTKTRENLIVAGSFGKSTLAAMLAFLLREAGQDPGYFIGAVPLDLPTTGHAGRDALFVMEGDEYVVSPEDRRSKFELYKPAHVLLSSIVHDHVNMFPTMADYEAPFAKLIAASPRGGKLVCARGYEPIRRLTAARDDVIWYGLAPGEGYGADDIEVGEITRFALRRPSGAKLKLETQLLGLHNVENFVGACAILLELGLVDGYALRAAAPKFRGVARRLDKKTARSRVPAYEGFGSSYEKARSAIEAISLHFPRRKQVVIFEPHTFSWRSEEALAWYDTVFDGVSEVLLLPPPGHGAGSHRQLSQDAIAARIAAAGVAVTPIASGACGLEALAGRLTGEEVVLLLSSGPLDGLAETAPAWLDERFG